MPSAYEVIIAPAALAEALEIAKFVKEDSTQAAEGLLNTFAEAFESLGRNPLRGAWIPENAAWGSDYRQLFRSSYRIIYRVKHKEVIVLKVVHGARMLQIQPAPVK